jgi:alkylhydroperoxidase family enzyme
MRPFPSAPGASTGFEGFLGHRPELLELYRAFYATLWDGALVDPALLEVCRRRIAQVHGCDAEAGMFYAGSNVTAGQAANLDSWESSTHFGPVERAALRLAERIPWNHHETTDQEFEIVREYLGEAGAVALVVALALFDARCRLRIAFNIDAPIGEVPAPSTTGPLY